MKVSQVLCSSNNCPLSIATPVTMKSSIITSLSVLLPLASGHFNLNYPTARGFNEDLLGNFPCGGQNSASPNRTLWPTKGGPIQLKMGHVTASVQVFLGLGNDVGSDFNITLVPIFQEQGLGQFCMSNVMVPSDLKITDGQNATIQVVTNGDPVGGLYNVCSLFLTSSSLHSVADLSCHSAQISPSPPARQPPPSASMARACPQHHIPANPRTPTRRMRQAQRRLLRRRVLLRRRQRQVRTQELRRGWGSGLGD